MEHISNIFEDVVTQVLVDLIKLLILLTLGIFGLVVTVLILFQKWKSKYGTVENFIDSNREYIQRFLHWCRHLRDVYAKRSKP